MLTPRMLLAAILLQVGDANTRPASPHPVLRPGEKIEAAVADGDPIVETETLLSGGYTRQHTVVGKTYRLDVDEPGTYHIDLRSYAFDSYLVLRDARGIVIAEDDDGLISVHSRIVSPLTPTMPGSVEVCALHGKRGPFALTLNRGTPPHLSPQQRNAADINDRHRQIEALEVRLGPDDPLLATAMSELGELYDRQGNYAAARPLYERSLAIRERHYGPAHQQVAYSLNSLGSLLQVQGDLVRALPLLQRSRNIFENELGSDHERVASVLLNLAAVHKGLGDYEAALPLYENALAIAEARIGQDSAFAAVALNNLGSLLSDQGDPTRARELCERALTIFESELPSNHPHVSATMVNLGSTLRILGDFKGSQQYLERALAIEKAIHTPDHPTLSRAVNELGLLFMARGEYARSRQFLELSLAINERSPPGDSPILARSLNNLGSLLQAEGDLEGARPLLERALSINEQHPGYPILTAKTLNNLGTLLRAQGELHRARQLLERSLGIYEDVMGRDHPELVASVSNLARTHADLGEPDELQALYPRLASSLSTQLRRNIHLLTEGELYLYLTALSGQQALLCSPSLWPPGHRTTAYESLLAWKGHALRIVSQGRERLQRDMPPAHRERLSRLQSIQSKLSQAMTAATSMRGEDYKRLEILIKEREQLERELGHETDEEPASAPSWARLQKALPARSALVDIIVHPAYEPARWENDRMVEPGDWTDNRISAWVTLPEDHHPRHFDLGPAALVEQAMWTFLDLLLRRSQRSAELQQANESVRKLLWEPIATHLADAETVIISPDGVVATLSWGVLQRENGDFLLEGRDFVYLTDPTMLTETSAQSAVQNGHSLLAVGGVDYSTVERPTAGTPDTDARQTESGTPEQRARGALPNPWPLLEASDGEALQVAARHEQSFGRGNQQVLRGKHVSEEALKRLMPTARVVHLATHGYVRSEGELAPTPETSDFAHAISRGSGSHAVVQRLGGLQPGLLSGLVCAGANQHLPDDRDNGYLTAEEVGWLDLSACDLAVLSACDTGLGRPQSGEGLLGLRRSFLLAGANTVISSLWSVPDQATAALMDRFYENLWEHGMGKAEALRAAQLEILAANRRQFDGDPLPRTWGAFVLDGDWR